MSSFFSPPDELKSELGRVRVFGPHAGIRVSPLQLGAMSVGEAWSNMMGSMTKEQSFALLDAFYEAGGNMIDTANYYQEGESEKWVGEWMKARGTREHMIIATKYTGPFMAGTVGKNSHAVNYAGNSRRSMHVSVRHSLEKLQTDWIDLLYMHVWDYSASIPEVMDALHSLVEQGKVMYLGVSNTPAWIVAAANDYAIQHGKTPFCTFQGRWNLIQRDIELEIVPMCLHYGMSISPWEVIGGGKFKTKQDLSTRDEPLRTTMTDGTQTEDEARASEALMQVAKEHGIESLGAVALAWAMKKLPYVFPIVGGRKVEHLRDNIAALSIKLTDKQMAFLDAVKPPPAIYPYNIVGSDPMLLKEGEPQIMSSMMINEDFVRAPRAVGRE